MIYFFSRLDRYMEFKGLNDNKVTIETGISNGLIGKARKRGALSQDNISKILHTYRDLDANWLFTGKGEMIKEVNVVEKWIEEERKERTDLILNDPNSIYRLKTDNNVESQLIPLYNLEASAGIVTLFKDNHEIEPIDYIQIPNLPKCDGAVHISGDSMYPLLKSGDIVMYKQVHDIKDGIYWGEMYLVSIQDNGDEMVMVKYIKKSERDGYIKLVSQNKHHEDREVLLKKVKALALIKASIRINSMS